MKNSEQDVLARAAEAALKTHPPLLKTAFQDKAELERLYPKGGDGKSTSINEIQAAETVWFIEERQLQAAETVWFIEERQLNDDWLVIDRADDHEEAEAKLLNAKNTLPGTYRLNRSAR